MGGNALAHARRILCSNGTTRLTSRKLFGCKLGQQLINEDLNSIDAWREEWPAKIPDGPQIISDPIDAHLDLITAEEARRFSAVTEPAMAELAAQNRYLLMTSAVVTRIRFRICFSRKINVLIIIFEIYLTVPK